MEDDNKTVVLIVWIVDSRHVDISTVEELKEFVKTNELEPRKGEMNFTKPHSSVTLVRKYADFPPLTAVYACVIKFDAAGNRVGEPESYPTTFS